MRLRTVLVVALLLLPSLAFAQSKKKKKASVPAIFSTAKYVYVQAEAGNLYDPRLLPEDRNAISNVMNALRDWGRYTVMPSADGAELIFTVRKGRLGSAGIGAPVGQNTGPYSSPGAGPSGTQSTNPNGAQRQQPAGMPGVMVGGEAGPPDDFLEVRTRQPDGQLSGPLWEHTMTGGLDAPRVPLVDKLKRAVEKDYPQK